MRPFVSELTEYGFNFGALIVERMWSEKGYAAVRLRTDSVSIIVQASPNGRSVYVQRIDKRKSAKVGKRKSTKPTSDNPPFG